MSLPWHDHSSRGWGQKASRMRRFFRSLFLVFSKRWGWTEPVTLCHRESRGNGCARQRGVFAGGGSSREQMESLCREQGILNAIFPPYAARNDLAASLGEGHLGLVTQLPKTCGSIVPSKTYGIMAAGRPILYIGP